MRRSRVLTRECRESGGPELSGPDGHSWDSLGLVAAWEKELDCFWSGERALLVVVRGGACDRGPPAPVQELLLSETKVDQRGGASTAEGVPCDWGGGELREESRKSGGLEGGKAGTDGVPPRTQQRRQRSPLDLTGGFGGQELQGAVGEARRVNSADFADSQKVGEGQDGGKVEELVVRGGLACEPFWEEPGASGFRGKAAEGFDGGPMGPRRGALGKLHVSAQGEYGEEGPRGVKGTCLCEMDKVRRGC